MNETIHPDPPGGVAGALGALRHALADPLSAAGLTLELIERRLAALPPNGSSLAERVRGAKAELAVAGRLIDLLPRLATIAAEAPTSSSAGDVCRAAGVPVERDDAASRSPLLIRRAACVDAVRAVARLLGSPDPGAPPPRASVDATPERVTLRIVSVGGGGGSPDADPERLFQLARGDGRTEELFLARAGVEADGGRLRIAERDGRLVALLSWSRQPPPGNAGPPA